VRFLELREQREERRRSVLAQAPVHVSLRLFPQRHGLVHQALGAGGEGDAALAQVLAFGKPDQPLALQDAEVAAEFDARMDKHILRVSRVQHGNVKSSVISADFIHGADYEALSTAGQTFRGLVSRDAVVKRGEGERQKEARVGDFREAMAWLLAQVEGAVARQRYKGLGEMNPQQLWETTMDPAVRRLLRVQLDDAIEADRVFTMLMGDEVEPRRNFIENNALRAANIDA